MTVTPQRTLYTASARSTGGRNGTAESADGTLSVDLGSPPELGGSVLGHNPEEFFALGYSACFSSAMALLAPRAGVDVSAAEVEAAVGLTSEGGIDAYGLTVALQIKIPGVGRDAAQELAEAAHAICPFSKAISGNVPVTVTAIDG